MKSSKRPDRPASCTISRRLVISLTRRRCLWKDLLKQARRRATDRKPWWKFLPVWKSLHRTQPIVTSYSLQQAAEGKVCQVWALVLEAALGSSSLGLGGLLVKPGLLWYRGSSLGTAEGLSIASPKCRWLRQVQGRSLQHWQLIKRCPAVQARSQRCLQKIHWASPKVCQPLSAYSTWYVLLTE